MKRKRLKSLIFFLGLLLLLSSFQGSRSSAYAQESALQRIQRSGVIRVGWALWYPWMSLDDKTKKLVGIGPDVMEELAKALGNVKIQWVADNWATLVAGLQSNKFDITYPLGVTLPRALAIDYTDDTMLEAQTFLIQKRIARSSRALMTSTNRASR